MRIDRLDLTRFGCFTDSSLDLSKPGMHIVVGANEAGKTTAMAAIRQLLYGIPMRSPHAFLHDLRDLRLGALLRSESDELLEIVRVKRQTDTLRDSGGEILDSAVLAKITHDVDEAVFASLFTVGHDEIVRGGDALLASDGELGRALFSASRGTADLNAVLRNLDDRAAALFKNAASVPKLNAAIKAYKDEADTAKKLSTNTSEVLKLDEQLQAARTAYELTTEEMKAKAQRQTLLERVRAARPLLATRQDCIIKKTQLETFGPIIDSTLGSQLSAAQSRRRDDETRQRSAQSAIDRLTKKLQGLSVDNELLEQRDAIETLQADVGGYRQNVKDLPSLVARTGGLERDLEQLRERLPAGSRLALGGQESVTIDQEERIQQLTERRGQLDAQVEITTTREEETTESLDTLRAQLDALDEPTDVHALFVVTDRTRGGGDLEATHAATVHRYELANLDFANVVKALGLGSLDHNDIDATAVPTMDAIRHTRSNLSQLTETINRIRGEIDALIASDEQTRSALAELLLLEQPPRAEELVDARSRRQEGWDLIRRDWLETSADLEDVRSWSQGRSLQDAYEAAVMAADTVADQLRSGADSVARRASLEHQLQEASQQQQRLKEELDQARTNRAEAETAWTKSWKPVGITPESPEGMETWHDKFRSATQQAAELRRLGGEIADSKDNITRCRKDLTACLTAVGMSPADALSFAGLLDYATDVVAETNKNMQERSTLKKSIAELETTQRRHQSNRAQAQQAMSDWQEQWEASLVVLGLGPSTSPNETNAVLKTLTAMTEKSRDETEFRLRITAVERRTTAFIDQVKAVLSKLTNHQDLVDTDPGNAVTILSRRLGEAQVAGTEHRATTEELLNHERDLEESALQLADVTAQITDILRVASTTDEGELAAAIARSKEYENLARRITETEEALRQASGLSMSEIEAEAQQLLGIEIDPEVEEIVREIDAMDDILRIQGELVGEIATKRSLISPSREAADAMTQAQQSLASVASYGDEYVEVVLAKRLLEEQVATYRDKHQGPILKRARELFQALTLGHYLGLDTDTDDKGKPYLLARTASDKLLEISSLSTGTRDQMYLALRLAALEQVIERRGSLPIVFDDLFVHFDDQRTQAGLTVLDQISSHAQVLLFTHHEQVATHASDAIAADRFTVHHLT